MSDYGRDKTTLIWKLRNLSACIPECEGRCSFCPDVVAQEAADEIERLRLKVSILENDIGFLRDGFVKNGKAA